MGGQNELGVSQFEKSLPAFRYNSRGTGPALPTIHTEEDGNTKVGASIDPWGAVGEPTESQMPLGVHSDIIYNTSGNPITRASDELLRSEPSQILDPLLVPLRNETIIPLAQPRQAAVSASGSRGASQSTSRSQGRKKVRFGSYDPADDLVSWDNPADPDHDRTGETTGPQLFAPEQEELQRRENDVLNHDGYAGTLEFRRSRQTLLDGVVRPLREIRATSTSASPIRQAKAPPPAQKNASETPTSPPPSSSTKNRTVWQLTSAKPYAGSTGPFLKSPTSPGISSTKVGNPSTTSALEVVSPLPGGSSSARFEAQAQIEANLIPDTQNKQSQNERIEIPTPVQLLKLPNLSPGNAQTQQSSTGKRKRDDEATDLANRPSTRKKARKVPVPPASPIRISKTYRKGRTSVPDSSASRIDDDEGLGTSGEHTESQMPGTRATQDPFRSIAKSVKNSKPGKRKARVASIDTFSPAKSVVPAKPLTRKRAREEAPDVDGPSVHTDLSPPPLKKHRREALVQKPKESSVDPLSTAKSIVPANLSTRKRTREEAPEDDGPSFRTPRWKVSPPRPPRLSLLPSRGWKRPPQATDTCSRLEVPSTTKSSKPFAGHLIIHALAVNDDKGNPLEKSRCTAQKQDLTANIQRLGGKVVDSFGELLQWGGNVSDDADRWVWKAGDLKYVEPSAPTGTSKPGRRAPAPTTSEPPKIYLVADGPNRATKYLMALAAGIPCIDQGWIRDENAAPWHAYLLPAGQSPSLGHSCSQWVDHTYSELPITLKTLLDEPGPVHKTLKDKTILFLYPSRSGSEIEEDQIAHTYAYAAVACLMGASRVEVVHDLDAASRDLKHYDAIVNEDESLPGPLLQFSKSKKGKKVICTDINWVRDCLITGIFLMHSKSQ